MAIEDNACLCGYLIAEHMTSGTQLDRQQSHAQSVDRGDDTPPGR